MVTCDSSRTLESITKMHSLPLGTAPQSAPQLCTAVLSAVEQKKRTLWGQEGHLMRLDMSGKVGNMVGQVEASPVEGLGCRGAELRGGGGRIGLKTQLQHRVPERVRRGDWRLSRAAPPGQEPLGHGGGRGCGGRVFVALAARKVEGAGLPFSLS